MAVLKDLTMATFTPAEVGSLRHGLQQADQDLAAALFVERDPSRESRLEFAQTAVRDALRWVNEDGDAATILVALEEVHIGDLSAAAARRIQLVRGLCSMSLWLASWRQDPAAEGRLG
jgi:hypothetical protein